MGRPQTTSADSRGEAEIQPTKPTLPLPVARPSPTKRQLFDRTAEQSAVNAIRRRESRETRERLRHCIGIQVSKMPLTSRLGRRKQGLKPGVRISGRVRTRLPSKDGASPQREGWDQIGGPFSPDLDHGDGTFIFHFAGG